MLFFPALLRLLLSTPTAPHVIAIGASSGGVAALLEIVGALPADLDAVVGIVLHVGSQHSILPELLSHRSSWPCVHAADGTPLRPGTIYVAPPDHHMMFSASHVRLGHGPRENHARPAVDPFFKSVALEWRERAIGVVLTGDMDDGTAGLAAIKACGGTAIVQEPGTAFQPGMPASALANVEVDYCLPVPDIAPVLVRLVRGTEPPLNDASPAPAPPLPYQASARGSCAL